MYNHPKTMSDTQPVVKQKLKIRGHLKQVSDAASIAVQIADLVRSWLGSNLESARGDLELLTEVCRILEVTCAAIRGRKFDKKEIALLVLQDLFPDSSKEELLAASAAVDFLVLYKVFAKKGLVSRLVKAVRVFF